MVKLEISTSTLPRGHQKGKCATLSRRVPLLAPGRWLTHPVMVRIALRNPQAKIRSGPHTVSLTGSSKAETA
eukprot:6076714-Prymnesium_polylepis.1